MTVSDTITSLGAALAPHYALERELGRGGMATVYLARDLRHERAVALKVLHPELGAALGSGRFQREIRVAARLSHPNILPLFDSGEAGGRLWYAMPYVQGESLRQRLGREAQLGVEEAVRITRQVAAALDYAHGLGIIHRDIKPENILLSGDQVLVADFGIAKALHGSSAEKLTETGLSLGTPGYMSPEQAAGGRLDARSDLYALGCVLYEMLAGAPPFSGPTPQAVMARHAVDPVPPLRTVRATVPPAVEQAVLRALAKVPADRFAAATQLSDALAADGPPTSAPRRHLSLRSAKLALGVVLIAGFAVVGARTLQETAIPAVPGSVASIAVLPLVSSVGDTGLVRLGRDLAITISASLDGVTGMRTADRLTVANATADRPNLSPGDGVALAKKLQAASILRGTLVRAGDNVRLDLGLYRTDGLAPLAERISVTNHRDSIAPLTDAVTWALLRRVWQRGEPPSPSLDAVTTGSLPALRAFLEGERALGVNRWNEAILAYRGALAADSSFALAQFRHALARWWTENPVAPESLVALRSQRSRFPERERLLIDAFLTSGRSPRRWIERYATVAQRFPEYWPAWFLYADALTHGGSVDGHDWTEALQAFQRVLALNPELTPAWNHVYDLAIDKDSTEVAKAYHRLARAGWLESEPPVVQLLSRLRAGVAMAGGTLPPDFGRVADSAAELLVGSPPNDINVGNDPVLLLQSGFPAAQLELNNRVLATGRTTRPVGAALRAANAWTWAARGRWDTALTIMGQIARTEADVPGTGPAFVFQDYGLAVAGALVGATVPESADVRRPRVVAYVTGLTDNGLDRFSGARLAWLDGVLGYARRDRSAIQAARHALYGNQWPQADLAVQSLAALERGLAGDRRGAGRELAWQTGEYCVNNEDCSDVIPDIAVQRFIAAQWLADAGEIEPASRLLRWQDGQWWDWAWMLTHALGGPTLLARARIEQARGETTRAREYYRKFLRRYDRPMRSQVHLVEEARAGLAQVGGLDD
jgi:serine/threonine-protein kinase